MTIPIKTSSGSLKCLHADSKLPPLYKHKFHAHNTTQHNTIHTLQNLKYDSNLPISGLLIQYVAPVAK